MNEITAAIKNKINTMSNDKIKAKGDELMDKIEAEAKDVYPDGGNFALLRQQGYIAGRTKSIDEDKKKDERIRELEDGLRELLECDYTSGTHLYCAQVKAKQLLTK